MKLTEKQSKEKQRKIMVDKLEEVYELARNAIDPKTALAVCKEYIELFDLRIKDNEDAQKEVSKKSVEKLSPEEARERLKIIRGMKENVQ